MSMHRDHNIFLRAIKERRKIRLVYFREEDNSSPQDKLIAPMDYHLGHRATDKSDYYYFWCSYNELWCFEMDKRNQALKLPSHQIVSIEPTEDSFNPTEFSTADVRWFLSPKRGRFNRIIMSLLRFFKSPTKSDDKHRADRRSTSQDRIHHLRR